MVEKTWCRIGFIIADRAYNNRANSDCQKQRGFRYATGTPLLSSGYAKRSFDLKDDEDEKTAPNVKHYLTALLTMVSHLD